MPVCINMKHIFWHLRSTVHFLWNTKETCVKKKNPSAYEAKMFRIQYSWAANFQHSRKNVPYFQPSEELAVRTRLTPELMLFPRFDRHRILCDHWCTPDRGSIFPGVRLSTSARNK